MVSKLLLRARERHLTVTFLCLLFVLLPPPPVGVYEQGQEGGG